MILGPLRHFRAPAFLYFFRRFGHIQVVALLSFAAVLAMFRRLLFYYFWQSWPYPGGCIFNTYGCFGHVQTAAFLFFLAVLAMFRRLHFCAFWPFRRGLDGCIFLFLTFLAMFRRLHFYYFQPFWPCLGSCIFNIVGRFGHVQAAAFSLFLAGLATFRRLDF